MPELPEVETIRRDLEPLLVGRRFKDVRIKLPKMVHSGLSFLRRQLVGKSVQGLERRGKLLMLVVDNGERRYLLIHLKMTGQLIYSGLGKVAGKSAEEPHLIAGGHSDSTMKLDELPNKYTHIIFTLDDEAQLFFNDLRQFGYVQLVEEQEKIEIENRFGVEPLAKDFTVEYLWLALKKRQTAIKNVLLDQKVIAGLGNIYVDEVCFAAGIRPSRLARRVTREEAVRLHRAIRRILKLALKHRGTTFNNYRDAYGRTGGFVRHLKVYGRGGQLCQRCRKSVIKRAKIGQRGTAYCPICQV